MASDNAPIVCKYNGTLLMDGEGNAKYSGGRSKMFKVPKSSTLSSLKNKIYSSTGIASGEYELKLIFMCPLGPTDYTPAFIEDDSDVCEMLDMHPQIPSILLLVDKIEVQRPPAGVLREDTSRGTYSQMLQSDASPRLSPIAGPVDVVPSTYPVSKPAEEPHTALGIPFADPTSHFYGAFAPIADYQQGGPFNLPEMAGTSNPAPPDVEHAGPSNYHADWQQEGTYYSAYHDYQTYDRYHDAKNDWNFYEGETPMHLGTPLRLATSPNNEDDDLNDPDYRVVLPEGSKNALAAVPFEVEQQFETTYSYLDVIGRTTVVIKKRNVVPEHNVPFQVYYDFSPIFMLAEPLMLVSAFFLFFVACIAYLHVDLSIAKS